MKDYHIDYFGFIDGSVLGQSDWSRAQPEGDPDAAACEQGERGPLRGLGITVGCRDSQSAVGYRIMVYSAGYRIRRNIACRTRCHLEQEKTQ